MALVGCRSQGARRIALEVGTGLPFSLGSRAQGFKGRGV